MANPSLEPIRQRYYTGQAAVISEPNRRQPRGVHVVTGPERGINLPALDSMTATGLIADSRLALA
ncbi:hypothetical protein BH23CHL5_BH23CHL5_19130 [soil metagenome]